MCVCVCVCVCVYVCVCVCVLVDVLFCTFLFALNVSLRCYVFRQRTSQNVSSLCSFVCVCVCVRA